MPGAAGVREKPIRPRSSVKRSSGSAVVKAIGASSPGPSSASPMSWSTNCAQAQPHWVTSFSEKRFWPRSLKIRLLTYRGDGPATIDEMPSA